MGVCILLTGQFRGRRVVLLKALEKSGLLVVTGPYKVNGVPLRRVNARYVIATSTKVSVAGVDVSKVNDAFFQRGADSAASETKKPVDAARKQAQKAVDDVLMK